MSRPTGTALMEKLVSLCKRRGFVYPASEIYGGLNGFWDYGPLGTQLKNNLRDRWWRDMVECPPIGPDGNVLDIVGIDSSIIQNPKAWVASGHVGGFSDPMVDCRSSKKRYRADHVLVWRPKEGADIHPSYAFMEGKPEGPLKKMKKALRGRSPEDLFERCDFVSVHADPGGGLPVVCTELLDAMSDRQVLVSVEGCEPLDLIAVEKAVAKKKLRVGIDAPASTLSGDIETQLERLGKKRTVRVSRGEAADTAEAWGELAHEAVLVVHDFLLHGTVAHSANVATDGPAAATLIVRHHHNTDALVSVFQELDEEGVPVLDIDNVVFEPSHSACLHLRLERVPSPDTLARIRRHETIRRVDLVEH